MCIYIYYAASTSTFPKHKTLKTTDTQRVKLDVKTNTTVQYDPYLHILKFHIVQYLITVITGRKGARKWAKKCIPPTGSQLAPAAYPCQEGCEPHEP